MDFPLSSLLQNFNSNARLPPDATAAAISYVTTATIPDAQKGKVKKLLWPLLGSVSTFSAAHHSRPRTDPKEKEKKTEKATGQSAPTKAENLFRPCSTKGNKVRLKLTSKMEQWRMTEQVQKTL